jgi:hypothetical protein
MRRQRSRAFHHDIIKKTHFEAMHRNLRVLCFFVAVGRSKQRDSTWRRAMCATDEIDEAVAIHSIMQGLNVRESCCS